MSAAVKLGIIGSNFVSDWLADSVMHVEGIENHAVYSRTAEKGAEFAAKHNIGAVYTDLEAFLTSDIDAVYIASPNALHFPQAMAAISHGKHVLCEKPIALDSTELRAMIDAARKNHVVLLEAMRPAFDPALAMFQDAIAAIGPVRHARFEFCQYSSRYDRFKAGEILNAFDPKLGNAALMDIGVYAVHTCVKVFGAPLVGTPMVGMPTGEIWAKSVKLANGFEGMGQILLPYGDFSAEILYSKITESVEPSIVVGEGGSVTIDKLSTPSHVVLHRRGEEPAELPFDRRTCNMEYEVEEFVRLVNRQRASDTPVENPHLIHSVNALDVMDKARALTNTTFR